MQQTNIFNQFSENIMLVTRELFPNVEDFAALPEVERNAVWAIQKILNHEKNVLIARRLVLDEILRLNGGPLSFIYVLPYSRRGRFLHVMQRVEFQEDALRDQLLQELLVQQKKADEVAESLSHESQTLKAKLINIDEVIALKDQNITRLIKKIDSLMEALRQEAQKSQLLEKDKKKLVIANEKISSHLQAVKTELSQHQLLSAQRIVELEKKCMEQAQEIIRLQQLLGSEGLKRPLVDTNKISFGWSKQ